MPAIGGSTPTIAAATSDRPAPTRPAIAENLAASHAERHGVLRIPPRAQRLDLEVVARTLGVRRLVRGVEVPADHQPDHVVVRQLLAGQRAGVRAVAQHDGAIGDRLDLARVDG